MSERHQMTTPIRRAFVISPSFHGATLLAQLLDEHPDVIHLGDTNPADHERCSCGQTVASCLFWQDLRAELTIDGTSPTARWLPRLPAFTGLGRIDWGLSLGFAVVDRVARRPIDRSISHRAAFYRDRQEALARFATARTNASVFVDGEKSVAKALFLTGGTPQTRIIHLVRDPRGYAWSRMRRGTDRTADQIARGWRRYHEWILLLRRMLRPRSSLLVRYEDLAQDPDATLARICSFIGADPGAAREAGRAARVRHIIGNRMISEYDGRIELDESWRRHLSEEDATDILRAAGRTAWRLGYR